MKMELVCSAGKEELRTEHRTLTFTEDTGVEDQVLNLYPQVTYQTFEGFGGALTDAAGYVFAQMEKEQQEELLEMYFSESRMNYQMVRIPMDSCDFSTHLYAAVEDEKDTKLESFSLAHTQRYILPLLDRAQEKAERPIKIMLTPWSPPAFMKTNGERTHGGRLKPEYRKLWAEYLCKYIEAFRERGYEVERISIQNEPHAVQEWDSCVYSAGEEKEFLRDFLHPALRHHGLEDVEIFIWDHNKERLFERAAGVIDEETASMVSGMAFHWYSGDHFEALDLVRKKFPDQKLILSESCLEFCKFDKSMEGANAARLAHDMIGNLNHGMHAFYDWNILLNEKGGPNHVANYCDAPYLFDEGRRILTERRILKYYWHFAHFIKPEAVRIGHTRYTAGLEATAWKNPNGDVALVMLNATEEELPCVIRLNGQMGEVKLEPSSIASGVIVQEERKL